MTVALAISSVSGASRPACPTGLSLVVLAAGIEPTLPNVSDWCPQPVDLASMLRPHEVSNPELEGLEVLGCSLLGAMDYAVADDD